MRPSLRWIRLIDGSDVQQRRLIGGAAASIESLRFKAPPANENRRAARYN
jgi:hypothetical protein